MSQTSAVVNALNSTQAEPDGIEQFQTWLLRNPMVSRVLIGAGYFFPGGPGARLLPYPYNSF